MYLFRPMHRHRKQTTWGTKADLGPVEDGRTKASLQTELMPLASLGSNVSIELGEQVAWVHYRRCQRQASRALKLLAPWAGWLHQQPAQ